MITCTDCYINFMHAHNDLAKLYTQESIASILMADCCPSCCWCSFSLRLREARFCSILTWAYVAFGSGGQGPNQMLWRVGQWLLREQSLVWGSE